MKIDFEDLRDSAQKKLEQANETPLKSDLWGIYSIDTVGCFCWYESWNDLVQALSNEIILCASEAPDLSSFETTRAVIGQQLERLGPQHPYDPRTLESLNSVLPNGLVLMWIGQLSDLLTKDHPFAREIREDFRANGSAADNSPILPNEEQAFLAFLSDYGF